MHLKVVVIYLKIPSHYQLTVGEDILILCDNTEGLGCKGDFMKEWRKSQKQMSY
jgi:hypothetical protein